jgi:hypothetical protein
MSDVRLIPSGFSVLVHPLTGRAKRWIDEDADVPEWARQGELLAIDPRMVPDLVDSMTAAGLDVEGQDLDASVNFLIDSQREFAKAERNEAFAKALDAVQEAGKKGLLSPLTLILAGDAIYAHAAGISILQWQRLVLMRFGGTPESLTEVIEELNTAGLLPWGNPGPEREAS